MKENLSYVHAMVSRKLRMAQLKQHRKECQSNPQLQEQTDAYEENKRLRQELAEKEKEIAFLKKAAAFFAKEFE